jgi:hypothetical protein
VPLLLPGLLSLPSIQSSARTVIEDQVLPGESNQFASFSPFGGVPIGGGTAVVGPALLASLKTWNGPVAKIDPLTGDAIAPASAPPAVKMMIAAANEIHDTTYIFGGGHNGPLSTLYSGYDCSGAVSFVLYAAGQWNGDTALDSVGLESYGAPGAGKWVTVYGSTPHAFMVIAGLAFDTSNYGGPDIPGGQGPRWRYCPTCNLSDGADWHPPRHPPGL